MYAIFDAQSRRQSYFDEYTDTTLEILHRAQVQDALGSQATALCTAIEASFLPVRQGDTLVLPPEQVDTDNIALYPALSTEFRLPRWNYMAWVRPADREAVRLADPEGYDEKMAEAWSPRPSFMEALYLLYALPHNVRGNIVHNAPNGDIMPLRGRSLIRVRTRVMAEMTDLLRASVIAHEFDHGVRNVQQTADEFLAHRKDPAKHAMYSVVSERGAYKVIETILASRGRAMEEHRQNVVTYIQPFEAAAAGRALRSFHANYAKKTDASREELMYVVAAGIGFLTEKFGDGSPTPTPDEVAAYRAAKVLHTT